MLTEDEDDDGDIGDIVLGAQADTPNASPMTSTSQIWPDSVRISERWFGAIPFIVIMGWVR
jgi:hypothetical protein